MIGYEEELPDSIYDLDPEEILDIDEDKLKEKYPREFERYDDEGVEKSFRQWIKDKIEDARDMANENGED